MDRRVTDNLAASVRLFEEAKAAIARFVAAEIETGMIFCSIARGRPEGERRRQNLDIARKAYEVAEQWIWKRDMQQAQFNHIAADLERLRFELGMVENLSAA